MKDVSDYQVTPHLDNIRNSNNITFAGRVLAAILILCHLPSATWVPQRANQVSDCSGNKANKAELERWLLLHSASSVFLSVER